MEDLDAAYAARLQAEENGRARTTRGGTKGGSAAGSKKGSPAKREGKAKKRKSKSKAKVESGEESGDEGERKEEKERKGGFHVGRTMDVVRLLTRQKPMLLSTPLAELLGEQTVRPRHGLERS
jgi:upstream activation factor subunit UAF30